MEMLLIVAAGWLGVSLLSGLTLLAIAALDGSLNNPPHTAFDAAADDALSAAAASAAVERAA
jgi:hypothetical protein